MSFGCSPQHLAPQNGVVTFTGGDCLLDGSGTSYVAITGDTSVGYGTYVRSITIKSVWVPNSEDMIRLFLGIIDDGDPYLINEIPIPAATNGLDGEGNVGTTSPSFGTTIYFNSLFLSPGLTLFVGSQNDNVWVVSVNAEYIAGYVVD